MIQRAATSDGVASRTLPSVEVRWACGALWFLCDDEDSSARARSWRNRRFDSPATRETYHGNILVYGDMTDSVVYPRRVTVFGNGVR